MTDPAEQPLSRREARKLAKQQAKSAKRSAPKTDSSSVTGRKSVEPDSVASASSDAVTGPVQTSEAQSGSAVGNEASTQSDAAKSSEPDIIAQILRDDVAQGLDPLKAADVRVPEVPVTSVPAKTVAPEKTVSSAKTADPAATMNEFDALLSAPASAAPAASQGAAEGVAAAAEGAKSLPEPVQIPGVFGKRNNRPSVPSEYSGDVLDNRPRRRSFMRTGTQINQEVLDALSEESLDLKGDLPLKDLNQDVESFEQPRSRRERRQREDALASSAVAEPAVVEPVVVEPVVVEPAAAEPAVVEPAAAEPDATPDVQSVVEATPSVVEEALAEAAAVQEAPVEVAPVEVAPVEEASVVEASSDENMTPLQRAIASGLLTKDLVQAAIDEIQGETQSMPIITDTGENQVPESIGEPVIIESATVETPAVEPTAAEIKALEEDYIAAILGIEEAEQAPVTVIAEDAVVEEHDSSEEVVAEDVVVEDVVVEADVAELEFEESDIEELDVVEEELDVIDAEVVEVDEAVEDDDAVEVDEAVETNDEAETVEEPAATDPAPGYFDPVEEALREVAASKANETLPAEPNEDVVAEEPALTIDTSHLEIIPETPEPVTDDSLKEPAKSSVDPAGMQSLILPGFDQDIRGPLSNTGEIILTGMIDLPQTFSETGSFTPLDAFDEEDLLDSEFDSIMNPMKASDAISATDLDGETALEPAKGKKANKVVVGSVLGVVAVAAIGLLVYALIELL